MQINPKPKPPVKEWVKTPKEKERLKQEKREFKQSVPDGYKPKTIIKC